MNREVDLITESKQYKFDEVFNTWEEFLNTDIIQDDKRDWQIDGKLRITSLSFVRGFRYRDMLLYETKTPDGLHILHQWTVHSSLTNGGLDTYVWLTDSIIVLHTNYKNDRNNRKLLISRGMAVMSTFTSNALKFG